MKNLLVCMCLIAATSAFATIEYSESEVKEATPQEISKNRACFDELAKQGCGDPGDNIKAFRSCLSEAFPSLTSDCQKMMSKLYKKR